MKHVILAGALAFTCIACAARPPAAAPEALATPEGRQAGGEPDSLGRVRPEMLNSEQVNRALTLEYPQALKEFRIGGTTVVHLFIDKEGIVRKQVVGESSGHAMLDSAALRVARLARFSPARNRDGPVALWISLNITFTPGQVH